MNKQINIREKFNRIKFLYLFQILFNIIIFVVILKDLKLLNGIVSRDEFGYWSNAAALVGYDWSQTAAQLPYFSGGSSLILALILKLGLQPMATYHTAVIVNAILVACSFNIAYFCGKKLYPNINPYIVLLFSFLITIYPSRISFAKMISSESYIMLVYWLITFFFIKLCEEAKNVYGLIISFLLGYLYMIHLRNIIILITGMFILLLFALNKKIKWKSFLSFLGILSVMLIVSIILKEYIKEAVYVNSAVIENNDYSTRVKVLSLLFEEKGIYKLFISMLGKLFYQGLASLFLFFAGMEYLCVKGFKYVNSFIFKKKEEDNFFNFYLFTLLSMCLTLLMVAFSTIGPLNVTHLLIGRYADAISGPILLLGLLELYKKRNMISLILKKYCLYAIILIIMVLILEPYCVKILETNSWFDPTSSPGISAFFHNQVYIKDGFYQVTIFIVMFSFLCLLLFLGFRKYKYIATALLVCCIMAFWIAQINATDKGFAFVNQQDSKETIVPITELVNEERPVYFILGNEYAERLQFNLPRTQFICLDLQALVDKEVVSDAYILCLKKQNKDGVLNLNYETIWENEKLQLFLTN